MIILDLDIRPDTGVVENGKIERLIKQMQEPRKFFKNRLLRDDFDPEMVTCTIDDVEVDCANLGDEYPAL